MKRHPFMSTLLVAVLSVATFSMVTAKGFNCPEGGPGFHRHGWHQSESPAGHPMIGKLFAKLDLTEEQEEQAKQIIENTKLTKSTVRAHMLPFMSLDPADENYQTLLDELIESKAEAMKAHMYAIGQAKLQIFEILTDEQKEEFYELQEKMIERFN